MTHYLPTYLPKMSLLIDNDWVIYHSFQLFFVRIYLMLRNISMKMLVSTFITEKQFNNSVYIHELCPPPPPINNAKFFVSQAGWYHFWIFFTIHLLKAFLHRVDEVSTLS